MTPQEHDLLKGLTDRVNQTQLTDKDPEAEQFIFQNLGKNSDSLYIMAQTILVQQYALDNAKKQLDDLNQQLTERNQQLEQLQQRAQQPVKHTSFLGSLLGNDTPAPPPPPPPQQYGQAQYQPVQTYAPPQTYAQPQTYAPPVTYAQPVAYGAPQGGMMGGMMGGGGSSFLRSAATTAAGVAAGAIAFEGIESLMHGFEHHAGYGGGDYGEGGFGGGPREEIINNYYGDSSPEHHDQGRDLTDRFAAAGDTPSPDIEDRRFADTSNDIPADDTTQFDSSADNFTDDSSSDNSGGFDDGGGGFDGGSDDSNS
jgi:hypothetical protein